MFPCLREYLDFTEVGAGRDRTCAISSLSTHTDGNVPPWSFIRCYISPVGYNRRIRICSKFRGPTQVRIYADDVPPVRSKTTSAQSAHWRSNSQTRFARTCPTSVWKLQNLNLNLIHDNNPPWSGGWELILRISSRGRGALPTEGYQLPV